MKTITKLVYSTNESDRLIGISVYKNRRRAIILWLIFEVILSVLSSLLVLPLIGSILLLFIRISVEPRKFTFVSCRDLYFISKYRDVIDSRDYYGEESPMRLIISPFSILIMLIWILLVKLKMIKEQ